MTDDGFRGDLGGRADGAGPPAAGHHRAGRRTARRARARRSGGAATCCTARTATAGRSATGRSASWRPGRSPCTRPRCGGSGARDVLLLLHDAPRTGRARTPSGSPPGASPSSRGPVDRARGRPTTRSPACGWPTGEVVAARRARGRAAVHRPRRPAGGARARRRSTSRWAATSSAARSRPTPTGATAVPGVWVAGNVADLRAQVITAAAAGLNAGAAINADLIAEETRQRGRPTYRHRCAHRCSRQPAWEERYQRRAGDLERPPEPAARRRGRRAGARAGPWTSAAARAPTRIWLAERGWQVTAVDISTTALERAAAHAAEPARRSPSGSSWRRTPTCASSRRPRGRTTWCRRSSCTCRAMRGGSCSPGWPPRWPRAAPC